MLQEHELHLVHLTSVEYVHFT